MDMKKGKCDYSNHNPTNKKIIAVALGLGGAEDS